ncbi:UNVERIFIED_CONTAM: uncharacterized protein YbjT (DUF2867 family) [Williamsia faeni]
MTTYLITGATGQIGTPTTAALRADGHDVRALSRRRGPGLVTGDLMSGTGIGAAMAGVDTVIHLATTNGAKDIQVAKNLFAAAASAHVRHVVLLSIVGIDKIPMGFYKQRLAIESLATASGVPLTLQRSTQFHPFVDTLFSAQRFLPLVIAPSIRFQPIATQDVAARLVTLAAGEPSGRVDDIGGPEQRTTADLLAVWKKAKGSRRPALPLRLPGKLFKAFAAGNNLVPGTPFGHETFDQYVAQKYHSGR